MIRRTMIFNDVHLPWNDSILITTDAKGLVLDICEDLKIDSILIAGDLLDMYNVSSYGQSPDVIETLETELQAGRTFVHALRKRFPKTDITYLEGNHEDRLSRFILKHSKAFWNLFTVEKYLGLEDLNIKYYPYNYKYRIEKTSCFVMHSPPSYGVNGARVSLLKKMDETYIYGCTHREQKACHTMSSGRVTSAYFNGCLCSTTETPEHTEVFSYAKGHDSWQQCFIIVTVVDEKDFYINQYSIRDHKVCVDGYLYEG